MPSPRQAVGYIEVSDLIVRYDAILAVDGVSFSATRGEQLTLLGPSGCGKTTILRSIAGLETPASGEIRIAGQVVFSSRRGVNLPAEKRDLSMVFQSYAIWPHMSIFENVAYGLRLRHHSRQETERLVDEALRLVSMEALARRDASALSGGQQQRVALARSIAFGPRALLMDEPLSNLDARLRARMRDELQELQRKLGITTIYVTHDQEEALALSDRIVVMRDGRIEQEGSPLEIFRSPRTSFVANFIGAANIIEGRVAEAGEKGIRLAAEGGVIIDCAGADGHPAPPAGRRCAISVRTVYPQISRVPRADGPNVWPGVIRRRVFLGEMILYTVAWAPGELQVRTLPIEFFEEGEPIFIQIDPQHVNVLAGTEDAGGPA